MIWQHELWHLEDLKKMGSSKFYSTPNWRHEESVWERIWATKSKWTENELVDSYRYYKRVASKANEKYKSNKVMEELLKLPYYEKIRYKQ